MAAPAYGDLIFETTLSNGTGSITLDGPITNRFAFSTEYANGDPVVYTIEHQTLPEIEVNLGTWTTGGILTRGTVIKSSNSNSAVTFSAGRKNVYAGFPADAANLPKITTFTGVQTTNHTWSPFTKMVRIIAQAGGGGGGGGRRGAAGTSRPGGGGGGSGARDDQTYDVSNLASTVCVYISGSSGAGGAGGSANNTNGSDGLAGNVIIVYNNNAASGTQIIKVNPGVGGSGGVGTGAGSPGGDGGAIGMYLGLTGGAGANLAGGSAAYAYTTAGAGGGGGGISAGNVSGTAGSGGWCQNGGIRQAGVDAIAGTYLPGGGGDGAIGGGSGNNGQDGGDYGAGGGGGGGVLNGNTAGNGGNGGAEILVFIEY